MPKPSSSSIPHSGRAQARVAAIVIVVTMIGWFLLSFIGGRLEMAPKYAFLIDLAALAAFAWAMIVGFKVWRARQVDKEG